MSGLAGPPRWLHPGAWWLWALGLATAATRTTNPLLLLLIMAVAGWVVTRRRSPAPWARAYAVFLKVAVAIVALRLLFSTVFGLGIGTHVLITLPEIPLPDWAAGVRIGGDITVEQLLQATYLGLQLAALITCFGAVNSLASPARLLRSVPAALYEVGVAVVVAMTFAPQLVTDVGRVRTAARLRGRPTRGLRGIARSVMPVLDGALERAVTLAAAMDSRGYGRTAAVPTAVRRTSILLLLLGLLGICGGVYGLLDAGTPSGLSLPVLALGLTGAVVGMVLAGRRGVRTRYRPDPWRAAEWLTIASGIVPALVLVVVSFTDPVEVAGQYAPPAWPTLPLLPAVAILVGLAPGLVTPLPPGTVAPVILRPVEVGA